MTQQRRSGLSLVELCVVVVIIFLLIALLLPAVQNAREEARKSTSKNNLKQIGLALHNYHDTWAALPVGGIIEEDGTPSHGWMVLMRPFMDASPLYNQIDFAEPWDSPHNWALYEIPHYFYEIPGVDTHFTSTGYALTHYLGNPHVFHRNSHVTFKDMKNGESNTWLAGEVAGHYQPWGYPFNWRPLGTKLCDGPDSFGHLPWDGGHLLLADGQVVFYSKETSPGILKQLMNAPPVPTSEQTMTPGIRFETDDVQIYRVELQSDPEGLNIYFVRGLQDSEERLLKMEVLSVVDEEKLPEDAPRSKGGPYPVLLFRVDRKTDVAARLKEASLAEDATPAQMDANIKTLKSLQKRLVN